MLIGAGLSRGAGYPDWNELMEPFREKADISPDEKDLPLVAQYFEQSEAGGRRALLRLLADQLTGIDAELGRPPCSRPAPDPDDLDHQSADWTILPLWADAPRH